MQWIMLSLIGCGPGLKLAWDLQPGDYSPVPAVADSGALITSSYAPYSGQGSVIAYDDAASERWRANVTAASTRPVVLDADGDVLVQDEGVLLGLDPGDGSELWRVEGLGYPGLLAVDAGLDTTYTVRANIGGAGGHTLVAIQDAAVLWEWPVSGAPSSIGVGAEGTVFLVHEALTALDPEGAVLWTVPMDGWGGSLTLAREHVIVPINPHGGSGGGTTAFSRADGSVLWSTPRWPSVEATVGGDGTVYLGNQGLCALDGESGEILWESDEAHYDVTIGRDGRLYSLAMMLEDPELPDLGSMIHFTVASASDGAVLWKEHRHDALDSANSSPNMDGRRVYFAGGYFLSYVYAFDGGPGLGAGPWPRTDAGPGNRRQER
jgi:outer membrane protein assembly factor BamB